MSTVVHGRMVVPTRRGPWIPTRRPGREYFSVPGTFTTVRQALDWLISKGATADVRLYRGPDGTIRGKGAKP